MKSEKSFESAQKWLSLHLECVCVKVVCITSVYLVARLKNDKINQQAKGKYESLFLQ